MAHRRVAQETQVRVHLAAALRCGLFRRQFACLDEKRNGISGTGAAVEGRALPLRIGDGDLVAALVALDPGVAFHETPLEGLAANFGAPREPFPEIAVRDITA